MKRLLFVLLLLLEDIFPELGLSDMRLSCVGRLDASQDFNDPGILLTLGERFKEIRFFGKPAGDELWCG